MKNGLKGFMLGVITTCLFMGATVAYAANSTRIEVYFEKLKYMFEGVEKQPTAAQGQGFIYNGTTYVPLRFVSESLGKEVGWNEATKTIWIGKQPEQSNTTINNGSSTAATNAGNPVYLTDLPGMKKEDEATSLNVDAWSEGGYSTAKHKPTFQIAGIKYTKGLGLYHHNRPYPPNIKAGGTVEVQLDGKYTKLTAMVGADEGSLSNTALGKIKFIGDGKELLVVESISSGQAGVPVELDVSDVKVLRINFNSNRDGLINLIVGDPVLTPAIQPTASASASSTEGQSDLIITERDKAGEFVVLKNRGLKGIDLKGWRVLSVNGNQAYTFEQSDILGPDSYLMLLSGEEGKNFQRTGIDSTGFRTYSRSMLWSIDEIWSNTDTDAAELYNPSGIKVSEYVN